MIWLGILFYVVPVFVCLVYYATEVDRDGKLTVGHLMEASISFMPLINIGAAVCAIMEFFSSYKNVVIFKWRKD